MFAAASGANQRQPGNANINAPFNHAAFERADDDPNLEGALAMYKECRWGCLDHMTSTLHPLHGFDWNLRKYAPFIEAFPQDAEALNRRWASFTALMSKEQLEALEDRSILTIPDWEVLNQKPTGTDEERSKLWKIYAKILNNPKRNDVLRILGRIENGERFCKAYTKDVHAQLVTLIAPLRQIVRDGKESDEASALIKQVGWELHKLGGMRAQHAVAFAISDLVDSELSVDVMNVQAHLNFLWDGCGDWLA